MITSEINKIIAATKNTTIVAATKYVDNITMEKLLEYNINNFGENRVDSFLEKYALLKDHEEIVWHFIGNLQTNKVNKMINKINYLHSLDSINLAKYIDKYRFKPLNCFLQINVTNSLSKHGIKEEDVITFLEEVKKYQNVKIIGLMTMTEQNMTEEEKLNTFYKLKDIKDNLNKLGYHDILELSMGMSDDYQLAIKASATFLRLGRILFEKGVNENV